MKFNQLKCTILNMYHSIFLNGTMIFSFASNLYNTISVTQHILSLEVICLKYVLLCVGNVMPVNSIVSEDIDTIDCGRKKKEKDLQVIIFRCYYIQIQVYLLISYLSAHSSECNRYMLTVVQQWVSLNFCSLIKMLG